MTVVIVLCLGGCREVWYRAEMLLLAYLSGTQLPRNIYMDTCS